MTYEELAGRLQDWAHRPLTDDQAAQLVADGAERAFGDLWIKRPLPAMAGDPLPPLYDPADQAPFDAVFLAAGMVELRRYESDAEGEAQWEGGYQRQLRGALSLGASQWAEPGRAPQVTFDGGFGDGS